jgi:hypothetical protein
MSFAGEAGVRHAFLPNSFRFATEAEAKGFIEHVKTQWTPAGFIWTTQTKWSKDPVNARWDGRKQKVVRLDVAAGVVEAPAPVTVDATDEDEAPPALVNEKAYRVAAANRQKRQQRRRIFNVEAWRNYQDESKWYDQEDLLSEALRHDLRHLIAHGAYRYELSRQLYEGFKAAHGGRAPGDMNYTVTERPGHGGCRYTIDQTTRQIRGEYHNRGGVEEGPHYEIAEHLITKSARVRGVKLQSLKAKSLAKLLAFAEEIGIESTNKMRKPEIIHAIVTQFEGADEDSHGFDVGEGAAGGSAMQELVRWLAVSEVHDAYRDALQDFEANPPAASAARSTETRYAEALEAARVKKAWLGKLLKAS